MASTYSQSFYVAQQLRLGRARTEAEAAEQWATFQAEHPERCQADDGDDQEREAFIAERLATRKAWSRQDAMSQWQCRQRTLRSRNPQPVKQEWSRESYVALRQMHRLCTQEQAEADWEAREAERRQQELRSWVPCQANGWRKRPGQGGTAIAPVVERDDVDDLPDDEPEADYAGVTYEDRLQERKARSSKRDPMESYWRINGLA